MTGMIGIVIVAHGGLAAAYASAVEHVIGPQTGMQAIAIEADDSHDLKQVEICHAVDAVDAGRGVVIVTDLFGSSPSNLSMMACSQRDRAILYGANMPMLLKLMKSRHLPLSDAINAARDAGRRYINSFEACQTMPPPAYGAAPQPATIPRQPSHPAPHPQHHHNPLGKTIG